MLRGKEAFVWAVAALIVSYLLGSLIFAMGAKSANRAASPPLFSWALLVGMGWTVLCVTLVGWGCAVYWRRKLALKMEKMVARDVYTLHPGTKALFDLETGEFRGYQLPSGKVVQQRYWFDCSPR